MNSANNKATTFISVLALLTIFITLYNATFGLILALVFLINGLIYLYITTKYNPDQKLINQRWSGLKRQQIIICSLIGALLGLILVIYLKISVL